MLHSIVSPANILAMVNLVQDLPAGDFAEIGVFRGGTAAALYPTCLRQGRTLHLFDTFTGTPCSIPGLDKHKVDDEFAAPQAEERIRHMLPAAKLYVGMYPDTHPEDMPTLAFVHCDCDQYESYVAVITRLWPLLATGGIMLFDDYPYLAGAEKAVLEYFPEFSLQFCGSRAYVTKGVTPYVG